MLGLGVGAPGVIIYWSLGGSTVDCSEEKNIPNLLYGAIFLEE